MGYVKSIAVALICLFGLGIARSLPAGEEVEIPVEFVTTDSTHVPWKALKITLKVASASGEGPNILSERWTAGGRQSSGIVTVDLEGVPMGDCIVTIQVKANSEFPYKGGPILKQFQRNTLADLKDPIRISLEPVKRHEVTVLLVDQAGAPIAKQPIALMIADHEMAEYKSDSNGRVIVPLDADARAVLVLKPGGVVPATGLFQTYELQFEPTAQKWAVNVPKLSAKGKLLDRLTHQPMTKELRMALVYQDSAGVWQTALAIVKDGEYQVFGLPPGKYQIKINCIGDQDYPFTPEPMALVLPENSDAPVKCDISLTPLETFDLDFVVKDRDTDLPLSKPCRITVRNTEGKSNVTEGTTGEDGKCRLKLLEGSYLATISAPDYGSERVPLVVRKNQDLAVSLTPLRSLHLEIQNADGAEAQIKVICSSLDQKPTSDLVYQKELETDQEGKVRFSGLIEGTYLLTFKSPQGPAQFKSVSVGREKLTQKFQLAPGCKLAGYVDRLAPNPEKPDKLIAYLPQWKAIAGNCTIDPEGKYLLTLAPGEYQIYYYHEKRLTPLGKVTLADSKTQQMLNFKITEDILKNAGTSFE